MMEDFAWIDDWIGASSSSGKRNESRWKRGKKKRGKTLGLPYLGKKYKSEEPKEEKSIERKRKIKGQDYKNYSRIRRFCIIDESNNSRGKGEVTKVVIRRVSVGGEEGG